MNHWLKGGPATPPRRTVSLEEPMSTGDRLSMSLDELSQGARAKGGKACEVTLVGFSGDVVF